MVSIIAILFNINHLFAHSVVVKSITMSKLNLATLVEGDPKAPFSIATTPKCAGGRYTIPWITPLYPWSLPYSAEC